MTKLNYINRKSEGVKLGAIVAKDLRRRTKSPGSATAAHTPIHLNLEGKNLTDAGIAEFASTLAEVLRPVHGVAPAQLQLLHLQCNGLTTQSLARLAPCIEAAAHQLEELDLSNNHISVDTPERRAQWIRFLRSFRQCILLKRLNLSDNDFSDFRAFEALSQEYVQQFKINSSRWDWQSDAAGESEDDSLDEGVSILSIRDTNKPQRDGGTTWKSGPKARRSDVCGLPAVPVVAFNNVDLCDAGALFLSTVIERHKWAQNEYCKRIWMHLKEEPERAMIETTGNAGLTSMGQKMLSGAETAIFNPFVLRAEDPPSPSSQRERQDSTASATRRVSGGSVHYRKASASFDSSELHSNASVGSPSLVELTNVRRRVERSIIENPGVSYVQLWHASLRLLCYAREFFTEDEAEKHWPPLLKRQNSSQDSTTSLEYPQDLPARSEKPTYASKLIFDCTRANSSPSSASLVLSVIGTTGIAQSPTVTKPVRRANAESQDHFREHSGEASTTMAPELKGLESRDDPKSRMIGPLPMRVWLRVFKFLADPHGVLCQDNVDSIVAYGSDRRTIAYERKLLGKSDSVQVWKVLERIGCLSY